MSIKISEFQYVKLNKNGNAKEEDVELEEVYQLKRIADWLRHISKKL
jgi:ribosomal protein S19E (S16A)